jgi:putative endonuclease
MAATYAQRKALGDYGERLAALELERLGFEVLDRNWRCRQGELDIVAHGCNVLVACEVKTRRSNTYGSAIEAITAEKAARLYRLIFTWCAEHGWPPSAIRVDVITVVLPRRSSPVLTHYVGVA